MCEKSKLARITFGVVPLLITRITDLFSFRDWWEHLSIINRNRFISVLNEGRVCVNVMLLYRYHLILVSGHCLMFPFYGILILSIS